MVRLLNWFAVSSTALSLSLFVAPAARCAIDDESANDDEAPTLAPGLVAEYRAIDGAAHRAAIVRVDRALNFAWRDRPLDPRLPDGPFSVRWHGRLRVLSPGAYRFFAYAAGGEVELTLNDKQVLRGKTGDARWLVADAVELDFGDHPIELRFRKTNQTARLGLYWSGPQFVLEPIPQRAVFHDPKETPADPHEYGRTLVRGLRCAACHDVPGEDAPLPAPSLANLSGNVKPAWLSAWVGATPHAAPSVRTLPPAKSPGPDSAAPPGIEHASPPSILEVKYRMPGMGIPREEAEDIVAFLESTSHSRRVIEDNAQELDRSGPGAVANSDDASTADARAGEKLFLTVGCLACHRLGTLGTSDVLGGGDLSNVADKRPHEFFARWLEDPAWTNPPHRMPVFPLSDHQRTQLAAYLATLGNGDTPAPTPAPRTVASKHQIERGRRLVGEYRCAKCHDLPDDVGVARMRHAPMRSARLTAASDWQHACLDEPDAAARRPGYRLTTAQREAVKHYLLSLRVATLAASTAGDKDRAREIDGAQVLLDRNCLACHARGLEEGIAAKTPALVAAHPELAPVAAALAPPALTGVGDKLHDEALVAAIAARDPPRRPWLKVRMPRFDRSAAESVALVRHLVDSDRIPDRPAELVPKSESRLREAAALSVAGRRLVTSDGFGCASCHQIGAAVPRQDNLAAQGTDLSLVGRRIRLEWFDRWVRNPARIVPRMEMPSVVIPVRGVLEDDLDAQLAAVWRVLNEPGFTPPEAVAVRVVRLRNVADDAAPAAVLTDVFQAEGRKYIRPLVVGLTNRHNVLFDFERNRMAAWWIGDTARQRTAGKTWYWEPGGAHLFRPTDGESELTLVNAGRRQPPTIAGQFAAELDWFEHEAAALRFGYRVRFAGSRGEARPAVMLHVAQTIAPISAPTDRSADLRAASGIRRRFEIEGVPVDASVWLRVLPGDVSTLDDGGRVAVCADAAGRPRVRIVAPADARFEAGRSTILLTARGDKQPILCELEYTCDLPADRYPVVVPPEPSSPIARLNVVPGFEAVRLPLPSSEMPIAFAWREDGTLVFASLKGQVWLARDTDGDGLEDAQTPISDDLAAPYGVAANEHSVDVINKNGLLRLYDRDGDDHAERTEVMASGWGHTDDYHDWAVGLPRDADGNYYVALPCQQDERGPAAAHLRGWVLKLAPRQPTRDDPRRFLLQPFAGGLRFPMGMALARDGALFVSDNQGNYNPYNELNHVVAGAHYGFINALESATEARPPRRDAAIEIPHPWTRSVNGICFLATPPELRRSLGRDRFGPLEGQLLGCEYDTRRLVRMSLERVGDTYQGAVYPLSIEPAAGGETFEGPVACAVAPDGDVYVGNLRDSGWGGGRNTGSIVRLRPNGELPAGIAQVLATPRGFTIEFTQPVDAERARRPESYSIECYRRITTPDYGGEDVDRQTVKIQFVAVSADARRAELAMQHIRKGFVYELRVKNLAREGSQFHPAEAYYTMRVVPK